MRRIVFGIVVIFAITLVGIRLAQAISSPALTSTQPEADGGFGDGFIVGDFNGDSRLDLAVRASGEHPPSGGSGRIYILDGESGSVLHELVAPNPTSYPLFGHLIDANDLNIDGVEEVVAIGQRGQVVYPTWTPTPGDLTLTPTPTPCSSYPTLTPTATYLPLTATPTSTPFSPVDYVEVYVFDGDSGSLQTTLTSPDTSCDQAFGRVAATGSFGGSAHEDVVVLASRWGYPVAYRFSGADSTLIGAMLEFPGAPRKTFPNALPGSLAVADLDADTISDLIMGMGDGIRAYSGLDGSLIFHVTGFAPGCSTSPLAIGDLDQDLTPDIFVLRQFGTPGGWQVVAISGADQSVLTTFDAPPAYPGFTICQGLQFEVGHLTADSVPDVVVVRPDAFFSAPGNDLIFQQYELGRAYVFSGATSEVIASMSARELLHSGAGGVAIADLVEDTDNDVILGAPDHWAGGQYGAGVLYACALDSTAGELNNDGNFIDTTPALTQDDTSRVGSDGAGDACDGDNDNDGLADVFEASANGHPDCILATGVLDPMQPDSDGDGYMDGAECAIGTNPNSSASKPSAEQCRVLAGAATVPTDTDGDLIQDRIEVCGYGTSTTSVDSDGDGAKDQCEIASLNTLPAVNSLDQLLLAQAIIADLGGPFVWNADLNKDGANNSADQLLMAQIMLSMPGC